MIRLIGAALIFLGCSGCGFCAASALTARRNLLRSFSETLVYLHAEISFRAHSLPEIFRDASMNASAPLSGVFEDISEAILADPGKSLSEHIQAGIDACDEQLPGVIRSSLLFLGSLLGGSDTEGQLRALRLCRERILVSEQMTDKLLPNRRRTCRILGVCVGAAAAIFFL